MKENLLLQYAERLAIDVENLCQTLSKKNGVSNTVFQIRKSSSSVFANVSEAQYPQSIDELFMTFMINGKPFIEQIADIDYDD